MGDWLQGVLEAVELQFRAVIAPSGGRLYGYELVIVYRDGEAKWHELQTKLAAEGGLFTFDLALRRKAFHAFRALDPSGSLRLFYPLPADLLDSLDYQPGQTRPLLTECGIEPHQIIFTLSERQARASFASFRNLFALYKTEGYHLCIRHFTEGYAAFELLFRFTPHIVSIGRSLIHDIETNAKKRLFLSHTVKIAQALGILVLAEGIESKREFYALKELGCDLASGNYLAEARKGAPTSDELRRIDETAQKERRLSSDAHIIASQLDRLTPLRMDSTIADAVDYFRQNPKLSLFPVVDHDNTPVGIVTDASLKRYIYSKYGLDIIQNQPLSRYMLPSLIVDVHKPLEQLLENFSTADEIEGAIVTDNFKYIGFLSAQSLLGALHEKNLGIARDQNPLTKLPGNIPVSRYIHEACQNRSPTALVYLDLDNFKPFNDRFGFRQGDRAILMLADRLRQLPQNGKTFIGHIGGDDFFVGLSLPLGNAEEIGPMIRRTILEPFADEVRLFYDKTERKQGYMLGQDRDGLSRKFPLLGVSAAIIVLENITNENISIDDITFYLADLKKIAKNSDLKFAIKKI